MMKASYRFIKWLTASVTLIHASLLALAEPPDLRSVIATSPMDVKVLKEHFGPTALPDLTAMIEDPGMAGYGGNIINAIGVVGGEEGVAFLIRFLEERFVGEVTGDMWNALTSVPLALGTEARMGSRKAFAYLVEHHKPSQWRQAGLKWWCKAYNGELLYRSLCRQVWRAFLLVGAPECREVLWNIANGDDPEYVELRQKAPDVRNVLKDFDAVVELRQGSPQQPQAPLAAPAVPGPASTPAVSLAKTPAKTQLDAAPLVEEAVAECQRIADECLKKSLKDVIHSLADNGRPMVRVAGQPLDTKLSALVDRLQDSGELEKTKALLADVRPTASKLINGGRASAIRREDGSIVVTIPLTGTEAVRRAHIPHGSPTLTVTDDEQLAIVMIKVEDRWYWNPFGW